MGASNPNGDSTITGLPLAQTLAGTEVIPADQLQAGTLVTVKIPVNQLLLQVPPMSFGVAFAAWFATLPTSLPGTPGQFWNNGNTLARS